MEEKLYSTEGRIQDLEHKLAEQDHVVAQLVGDNLDHLQDNMRLTTHINSLSKRMQQLKTRLGQVGSVLMGMIEGAIKREGSSSPEARMLDASGKGPDNQDGGTGSRDASASQEESMRRDSLMPWEGGLIAEMEREVMEAGAGGWFNGNPAEVLESWSGSNSDASASQDQVRTTLLTTIGGRTLPNPVRVPNNIVQSAVLRSLMEGPLRPWQCLVWAKQSPPYAQDLPPLHMSGLSHILLQIGPYYEDLDGEYRGGGSGEEREGNEGGDASVE